MRLLYLTAEVPYPLTSGYLRHYHLLRLLSRRHEIVLLSLTRRAAVDPAARVALAAFAERVIVFGPSRRSGPHRARRWVELRRSARELRRAVAEQLAGGAVDAVVLTGKDTFPALRAVRDVPLVIDVCDAASLRLAGQLALTSGRRRLALRARVAEMRAIERRLAAATPHLLFASERDRTAILGDRGGVVMPNAVDLDAWRRHRPPSVRDRVVFTGVMSYAPNHDAALRLVRDVVPRIRARRPATELVLAGRDPLGALRAAAASRGGVEVTGACADLRPHVEEAAVYCAPLRFAAGVQNKLLEALAMEVPVVATPVAAAGLRTDGEDPPIVVADDDDGIAAAVAALLADPAERARLAAAGRRFVERHFSWERSAALLEAELAAATGAAHTPAARTLHDDVSTAAVPR